MGIAEGGRAVITYFGRTGPALGAEDVARIQQESAETDYRRVEVDLTTARVDSALGISGTSIYIADEGGADWQIKLRKIDNTVGDALKNTDLPTGTTLIFRFADILVSNAAAATGTAPLVLIVGGYL